MCGNVKAVCFLYLALCVGVTVCGTASVPVAAASTDLDTSATSAKLFNLGSLFGGRNPSYGYGSGGYYPSNTYRPTYPGTGSYYPSTYYPSTSWSGSNYPSYGGYYPATGGGYYPAGTGTNILGGNGGYGGYGGNGGLHQYYGYWNPDYTGQRYRGYGYYADTDRYGLPNRNRYESAGYAGAGGYGDYGRDRDRDRVYGSYRGYD